MKLYTMIATWGSDAIVLQAEGASENEALVRLLGRLPMREEDDAAQEDLDALSAFAQGKKRTKLEPCVGARHTWVWLDGVKLVRPLTAYVVETAT